jgi:ribosomal protein S14
MYKLITNNKILSLNTRTVAAKKLHDNHLKQHIRKVCLVTGRSRGLISSYGCSRIK